MTSEDATGEAPMLVVKASRLATKGRGLAAVALPSELSIFGDRVQERTPGLLGRHDIQSIRFEQIAQVRLKRGVPFCSLTVESTGGHVISIRGLSRGDADRAKLEIEERTRQARQPTDPRPVPVGVSEELVRLARLRDEGALSEDEFIAAKQKLLGL